MAPKGAEDRSSDGKLRISVLPRFHENDHMLRSRRYPEQVPAASAQIAPKLRKNQFQTGVDKAALGVPGRTLALRRPAPGRAVTEIVSTGRNPTAV